jgi:hypothetical protein
MSDFQFSTQMYTHGTWSHLTGRVRKLAVSACILWYNTVHNTELVKSWQYKCLLTRQLPNMSQALSLEPTCSVVRIYLIHFSRGLETNWKSYKKSPGSKSFLQSQLSSVSQEIPHLSQKPTVHKDPPC